MQIKSMFFYSMAVTFNIAALFFFKIDDLFSIFMSITLILLIVSVILKIDV